MANIFFDFDGTIINSQFRLYNLFVELCPECSLSYDEYWVIKRNGVTQRELLFNYYHYDECACQRFKKLWLNKIEEPSYLLQDFLVDGILYVLEKASQKHSVYLVTNRQSKQGTLEEVERLGITEFFKEIYVTEQNISKADIIKNNVPLSATDILIGDSIEDIKYAKNLDITSYSVSWGISSYDRLQLNCPDKIFDTVMQLERSV